MVWSSKTKPTPANIRKRIDSAIEALEAAGVLVENHGALPKAMQKELSNAKAWACSARRLTERRR